jgi:hypothetical protein
MFSGVRLLCIVILSVCVVFLCICAVLNVLMFAQLPGGWLEVSTRKVLPGFPVSKTNAEMVPNFPS